MLQAEMDASAAKIRELVTALDGRKDEAIERTFKVCGWGHRVLRPCTSKERVVSDSR
jgi:hypothetical protein